MVALLIVVVCAVTVPTVGWTLDDRRLRRRLVDDERELAQLSTVRARAASFVDTAYRIGITAEATATLSATLSNSVVPLRAFPLRTNPDPRSAELRGAPQVINA